MDRHLPAHRQSVQHRQSAQIPEKRAAGTEPGEGRPSKKQAKMADKAAAATAKATGNACLTGGDFQGAVDAYTEAIGHDANDKVFYSNRSAAYASMKNFEKALEDGKKCVEVEPSFAKGYGRAGAAFHGMGQFEEAEAIYKQGLEVDPVNAQLKQGLEAAQSAAASVGANPIAQLFSDPANLQKLAMNPTTMGYLQDPEFVAKCVSIAHSPRLGNGCACCARRPDTIRSADALALLSTRCRIQAIAENPSTMNEHMKDERIMAALSVMMGMGGEGGPGGPGAASDTPASAPAPAQVLTEEEKEAQAIHNKAEVEKKIATELYKEAGKLKKDPEAKKAKVEEALAAFTRAAEIEPTHMGYLNNRAACMFELKQYEECRAECKKAVKVGKETRARGISEMLAKAYAREGNCFFAEKDFESALTCYDESLLEDVSTNYGSILYTWKFTKQAATTNLWRERI